MENPKQRRIPKRGFIYKITCLINKKPYIGQTTTTVKERFAEHCTNGRNFSEDGPSTCRKLYRAMRCYGTQNFVVETIYVLEPYDKIKLDEIETHYIKEFDSIKNGYNLMTGGGSSGTHTNETRKLMSETIQERRPDQIDSFRTYEESKGLPMYVSYHPGPGPIGYIINGHRNCDKKSFTLKDFDDLPACKIAAIKFLEKLDASETPYEGSRNGDWTIPKGVSEMPNGYRVRFWHNGVCYGKAFADKKVDDAEKKRLAIAYLKKLKVKLLTPEEYDPMDYPLD